MLHLKNIKKDYLVSDTKVAALKGLNILFREHEFVSILGPSGCGKTTLLNIIGGLDDYTDGDLIINGKSTKEFKDRDWDTYRNHRVGFVFQSYNLISHQTVLKNVELALTLSGVSKSERRKRAITVLKKVGLGDQIYKRPNQMSGGQMQRVAIARALVNDPDIILADEPTGALDSETSVQIMNLLKEISKDKLIIMVTHNAEIATEYSTRIIRLLDGKMIGDSNPFDGKEEEISEKIKSEKNKNKKTSMSFMTAFSLSLNNLLTKKGRTILTSFAGSIGIIGIALILSLSKGVDLYIERVQKDTLSTYPVSIMQTTIDTSSLITTLMSNNDSEEHDFDKVYSNDIMLEMIETMSSKVQTNNLKEFKHYIEKNNEIKDFVSSVQYGYNLNLQVYKNDKSLTKVNPSNVLDVMMMGNTDMNSMMSQVDIWEEMLDNENLLKSQYDLVKGAWPKNKDEIVLVVDENNEISDYALYSLGLKDQKELAEIMNKLMNGEKIEAQKSSFEFDDLLNTTYKVVLNTDYYTKQGSNWVDMSNNIDYMSKVVENGLTLKIVGIIRPNEEATATSMTGSIGYLSSLVEYISDKINETEIAKEQLKNSSINVFTGKVFQNAESYEMNLMKLGIISKDSPSSINFYASNFENKEKVIEYIKDYNDKVTNEGKEENVINYSDVVGAMMDGVSSIVDTISYVLIAFVTISLVVSSIMIGIITYISVLERTKEIGILRAIGASKKDISRVFNAETMIVGLVAGGIGILATLGLNVVANIIIKSVTNISNLASLPLMGAIILIIISTILTLIAGLIPSRLASKKDPVEALRTE